MGTGWTRETELTAPVSGQEFDKKNMELDDNNRNTPIQFGLRHNPHATNGNSNIAMDTHSIGSMTQRLIPNHNDSINCHDELDENDVNRRDERNNNNTTSMNEVLNDESTVLQNHLIENPGMNENTTTLRNRCCSSRNISINHCRGCSRTSSNRTTTMVRILFPWLVNNNENDAFSSINEIELILHYYCGRCVGNCQYKNDSLIAITIGVATLIAIGSIIGLLSYYSTKSSSSSSSADGDIVSSCIGYIYVIMWSVSFYPQCIMNLQRRTCTGLSVDFCWYNFIGFICYTTYNISLYFNKTIQHQYHQRHDNDDGNHSALTKIPIQSNDVAFAVHALTLCTILLFQVGYYDGMSALLPSRQSCYILAIILSCIVLYLVIFLVVVPMITTTSHSTYETLDYIYFLSYIKVCITCMKYIPQVYFNYHRRSTVGWNIWQILLDLFGGIFSTAQLIYDAPSTTANDVVISNLPKFMLGNISIAFDVIFVVQHYYLFPTASTTPIGEGPSTSTRIQLDEHPPPVTYHILSASINEENSTNV